MLSHSEIDWTDVLPVNPGDIEKYSSLPLEKVSLSAAVSNGETLVLEKLGRGLKAAGCRLHKAGYPILMCTPRNGSAPYLAVADIRITLAEGCSLKRPGYRVWVEGRPGGTCIAGWAGEGEVRALLDRLAAYNPAKYGIEE